MHVIFAIPQTELTLKTEQEQELRLPVFPDDAKVKCTFVTEFHKELKATMVAQQIFFLTNFISEYLRENKSVYNIDGNDSLNDSLNDS